MSPVTHFTNPDSANRTLCGTKNGKGVLRVTIEAFPAHLAGRSMVMCPECMELAGATT